MHLKKILPALTISIAAAAMSAPAAQASIVLVEIHGTVEFNGFGSGPLAGVQPGDAATMSFLLNSENFVDSLSFPTRGYVIDVDSFQLTLGGASIGLENPYPAGQTPFFVLRDNDPAVDGFLISENVDLPFGVDTSVANVDLSFLVTYGADTLSSLDIRDAVGEYTFAGISVFNWTLDLGPGSPMGMIYDSMTISVIPAPAGAAALAIAGLLPGAGAFARRRRTSA